MKYWEQQDTNILFTCPNLTVRQIWFLLYCWSQQTVKHWPQHRNQYVFSFVAMTQAVTRGSIHSTIQTATPIWWPILISGQMECSTSAPWCVLSDALRNYDTGLEEPTAYWQPINMDHQEAQGRYSHVLSRLRTCQNCHCESNYVQLMLSSACCRLMQLIQRIYFSLQNVGTRLCFVLFCLMWYVTLHPIIHFQRVLHENSLRAALSIHL